MLYQEVKILRESHTGALEFSMNSLFEQGYIESGGLVIVVVENDPYYIEYLQKMVKTKNTDTDD